MNQAETSRAILAASQNCTFPYEVHRFGLVFEVHPNVFSPREFHGWETFAAYFPDVQGRSILEIGCGAGMTSLLCANRGASRVVAVDINPSAVVCTRENAERNHLDIEVRHSDLFSSITEGERFEIIYWNSPFIYLPENATDVTLLERSLFDPGYHTIEKYLQKAPQHLTHGGQLLLGFGDFGDWQQLREIASRLGYEVKIIGDQDSDEGGAVRFQLIELTFVSSR